MILQELLKESTEVGDKTIYEMDADHPEVAHMIDYLDPFWGKHGLIINRGTSKIIGLKAGILKITNRISEKDLTPSRDYVMRDYQTVSASGGYLKKARLRFNEDQLDIAIIDAKPYNKMSNGQTVTFIHPHNYNADDLSKLIDEERSHGVKVNGKWESRKGKVIFFNDVDANNDDVNVESFPEYAILNRKLKNVTDAKAKERGTYKFIVDPDTDHEYWEDKYTSGNKPVFIGRNTWREQMYLLIFSTGYVRLGGTGPGQFGEDRLRVLHKPEGSTDLERKKNAWKAAVDEAKKRKWM